MEKNRSLWLMRIISILLAVFLWIYVTNELNPTKEQVLRQIPIETRGLETGLVVGDMPDNVSLRVQGNQNVMADLTGKSVEVWVDLNGVREGNALVPVQVKLPAGVRLMDISPGKVTVQIERIVEKHVRVKVETTSRPADGYRQMKPAAKPSQVVIKGPESVLAAVDAAAARVDMQGRTGNVLETVPVQLIDRQGRVVDNPGVAVVPGQVEVFVPVVNELPSKTVPVRVTVTGIPAEGQVVGEVIPEPRTVTVTGRREVLDGIREIATEAVDVTGAKEDVFKTVRPVLPAGVASPAAPEVRVLVKIGPAAQEPGPQAGSQSEPQSVPQALP